MIWIFLGLLSCSSLMAQDVADDYQQLRFHTFSEAEELTREVPKPIVVFLHAEWCRYCKNMEQTTFKNEDVIKLLNEDYYFVSFDGESREPVSFKSHTFEFKPSGRDSGTHELAFALGAMEDGLTYPTLVVLNVQDEISFQQNSFLSASQMTTLLSRSW
ncbi:MAG: thioredoxin family protein [Bacteroidota bacterium]